MSRNTLVLLQTRDYNSNFAWAFFFLSRFERKRFIFLWKRIISAETAFDTVLI